MMITAKSGFWSFKCSCGASFQTTGDRILSGQPIGCPNCGSTLDMQNLKAAVESLFGLEQAIVGAAGHGGSGWRIIPPKVYPLVD